MNKRITLLSAAAFVVMAGASQAATVTFGNFTYNDKPNSVSPYVTITDIAANEMKVTVGLLGTSGFTGSLSGLGFNYNGSGNVSAPAKTGLLVDYKYNTDKVGGGANFSGDLDDSVSGDQKAGNFNIVLEFNKVSVTPNAFEYTLKGNLTAADFTRVGLRFQQVGKGSSLGNGSNKILGYAVTPPPDAQVPLPAAGLMLLSVLGGLAALRRRFA